jgi:hypothetical protein
MCAGNKNRDIREYIQQHAKVNKPTGARTGKKKRNKVQKGIKHEKIKSNYNCRIK